MTWAALAFYVAATIVMTWPVAAGVTAHLPNDLGDSAFVCFVIAWGSKHWLELLSGDLSAAIRFWSAPIYYPEPMTTALSEHFALHSLITLPVFAVTENAVLCYNLWFLASYALAGFFMFLLVRAITGQPWAACVAGLAFAFAPYRFGAPLGHLQVLSSFWMPLVLLGIHRYVETGRPRPLVGAAAALWAQSLASGYYLVFFGPFVGVFALVELITRRRLTDARAWMALTAAAAATFVATMPFAWPYVVTQRLFDYTRPLTEIERFSADVAAWLTASPHLHLWGWLRTLDKPEGSLFPGLATVALSLLGLVVAGRRTQAGDLALRRPAVLVMSFALITLLLTTWMALGPTPALLGKPVGIPSIYRLVYEYLPGFDIVRVPTRMAMIAALATSLLVGTGVSAFDRPARRWGVAVAAAGVLADGAAMPLPIDYVWSSAANVRPPDILFPEPAAPPVYKYLKSLPDTSVIAELPFGLPEREVQYTYYSAVHRRKIVNGYSGYFPASYMNRVAPLRLPAQTFGTMHTRLAADGVTHVVVHADAWKDDTGFRVAEIFEKTGFPRVAAFGSDYVFLLELQK